MSRKEHSAKPNRQSKRRGSQSKGGGRKSKGRVSNKALDLNAAWRVVNPHAAGMDIGSTEHYVAVPGESREVPLVERFGCYTPELYRMAHWLEEHEITSVAMEATGVYWIPVMELLESEGFEVVLIRPTWKNQIKTDVKDCRALQRLHTFGLLRGSFRPCEQILPLRAYWRQRTHLVQQCSRQIQLMQKALEQMNVQLHKAVSDITGVTGMRIIQGILDGEHDPHKLATLRHKSIKASEDELAAALTGNYRVEHIFCLRQAVEAFRFLHTQIQACDKATEALMNTLPGCHPEQQDVSLEGDFEQTTPGKQSSNKKKSSRRKNQPYFDVGREQRRLLGVDLTVLPGISELTVQTFITEVGMDVAAHFETEKHFSSWLGLCPNNRVTGGYVRSSRTRPVANRLATALRISAQSLEKSDSSLGAFYRRLKGRKGPAKAITATARKLACYIYRMVTTGQQYVEKGMERYETEYREKVLHSLARRAKAMGYELLQIDSGEVVS